MLTSVTDNSWCIYVPGLAYWVDTGETDEASRPMLVKVCKKSSYLIDKDTSVSPADWA